jgi:dTMP kinase
MSRTRRDRSGSVTTIFTDTPTAGFLVTIEGPNGAGKTSLTEALTARLAAAGASVHRTRQPSPTPLGDTVRASEREVKGRALACLVAGDRHHQASTEIIPRLQAGQTVICDRYIESSLVLQRFDGVDTEYLLAINSGIPRPALRIQLEASATILAERLGQRSIAPERRFERVIGPARELELYAQADRLLTDREQLKAHLFDTTSIGVDELAAIVADLVISRR